MRNTSIVQRVDIDQSNAQALFLKELDYVRAYNQYPVDLFGYHIINVNKNINLQIMLTELCNYSCPFCNEYKPGLLDQEIDISPLLDEILNQYDAQGITPSVTITGGEPTLVPDRVNKVVEIIQRHGITRYNLNTNGAKLDEGIVPIPLINLSRHHYDLQAAGKVFCCGSHLPAANIKTPVHYQCVLLDGEIDSLAQIKKYMDYYLENENTLGFSFRGLSKLDEIKDYLSDEIRFTNEKWVDLFEILKEVASNDDFSFEFQKIGDHYLYEIYEYKGVPVRFTYTDFELLRKIEKEERDNGQIFSRAMVIRPDGKLFSGWTYDINEIVIK